MTALPTVAEVAQTIDHAILKPNFTRENVIEQLKIAAKHNVFSVCVRPSDVKFATQWLQEHNSNVKVGTVIGFPHGVTSTASKVAETIQASRDGAKEVDMVVNIGRVKDHAYDHVANDIVAINKIAKTWGIEKVKVILETAYLTDEEIAETTKIIEEYDVDFVKTSTGFAHEGATEHNIKIMVANVNKTEVKASGGITSLEILLNMRELGVTRFGTSATELILTDLNNLHKNGATSGQVYEGTY